MLKYFRILLFPFNLVYGLVVYVRNKCYDWGIFQSVSFDVPVICIGNLVVGGAGKTPTTEYLVRLLSDYKIAILSRGYGRRTKGFVLADVHSTAQTIGDEPLQYYRKFKQVTVAVCEDRVRGINQLKDHHDVILLDDAYQHRSVKPGYSILLFEFSKLQSFQFLLPAGNLREPFYAVERAQSILITKSPTLLTADLRNNIEQKFNLTIEQQLSFSSIRYGELIHLLDGVVMRKFSHQHVFLLTGIANPAPLIDYLKKMPTVVHTFIYADHHDFSRHEIEKLVSAYKQHPAKEKIIITTEKDSQRLLDDNLKDLLLNLPIYYLPIAIELQELDKNDFDQKILDYVASAK